MAVDKKKIAERYLSEVKSFITFISKNVKENFENSGDELINNSGMIGSIVKLLGQKQIDEYFEKKDEEKLDNFGVACYLEAAITCCEEVLNSLDIKKEQLTEMRFNDFFSLGEDSQQDLKFYLNLKFNPAIQAVKKAYVTYLVFLNIEEQKINLFKKNFESGIEQATKNVFGNLYEEHLSRIKEQWFIDNEERLLATMYSFY